MLPTLASISSLLVSFLLLCVGVGLTNTLLGIRGTLEAYSNLTLGLMMSAYYCGFIFGTHLGEKLIVKVGQIRTFSALAAALSALMLLYVVILHPASWVGLRFFNGLCMAGAYLVIESWLNALSTPQNRGRVLSVYMILNSLGLASAQLFFRFSDGSGFTLFAISSILVSLSLVPLILSRTRQPEAFSTDPLPLPRVYAQSPLATVGAFAVGLAYSAFFGLTAPILIQSGLTAGEAGQFLACALVGGLIMQWPLGSLSDRLNRRVMVIGMALAVTVTALLIGSLLAVGNWAMPVLGVMAFIFGGFSYPLYSVFLSILNDGLEPNQFVKASVSMLTLNGAGAIIGPLIGAMFTQAFGASGLYWYVAIIYGVLAAYASVRLKRRQGLEPYDAKPFVVAPRSSLAMRPHSPLQDDTLIDDDGR